MLRSGLACFSSQLRDVATRRMVEAERIAYVTKFSSAAGTCIMVD